ncbi:glycoside hydrolase family 3 protein [Streptomonospora sp. S1-112]|uniref:Glycoside hydrolase family 3 protein n=1 Tax=Streptomonospora mangrovi TaxID=2883123 RepID=A0A9X3NL45_9ACTN|nr:glycoside hydrolase family 3 N-terminal domain-containing protein [Streptomonospora mangrovi]MDA0564985.1 glycoside hydrolase family 3 protein [Streptomonospora mangrovi]
MTAPGADPAVRRMAHTVLMPGFTGTDVPAWLERAIGEGLAAVCYFAPNLAADPAGLSARLHALRPDLLTASDEEGGRVTRLHAATGSPHPGHGDLGAEGDPRRTAAVAEAMGRDLRAAGITAALAPVADLRLDTANPVVGGRSFGADPDQVAAHTAAFVRGLHAAGVRGAVKHFPGHGATRVDSHVALPVVDVALPVLRRRELAPFAAAVAAGADMVMAGHIVVPDLDTAPASVSPAAYRMLRADLGFTGAAVTDALDMRGLAAHTGAADPARAVALGAAAALAAGADLLCLGNPGNAAADGRTPPPGFDERVFTAAREAVLAAVDSGAVPVARLAEAAGRVERLLAGPASAP